METPADFIDALKARYHLPSDYAVAKELGLPPSRMSCWRAGRQFPSEKTCFDIAEMLDVSPVYVLACIKSQSVPSPIMRKRWKQQITQVA